MSYFLTQILIASSSDSEDRIWMQLLVFMILAAGWGVYTLVKKEEGKLAQEDKYLECTLDPQTQKRGQSRVLIEIKDKFSSLLESVKSKAVKSETIVREPLLDFKEVRAPAVSAERARDLDSGMELLDVTFLLDIVEKTSGKNNRDVMMRKFGFGELLRRDKLSYAASKSLKVYAIDKDRLYGKNIQCEAMEELATRTAEPAKSKPIPVMT